MAAVGLAQIAVTFVMLLLYRRHRIAEHDRGTRFVKAQPLMQELRATIRQVKPSTATELDEELGRLIQRLREIVRALHGPEDDPDLVVWLLRPDVQGLCFRFVDIAHSDAIERTALTQLIKSTRVPLFSALVDLKRKRARRLTYGSLASWTVLEPDAWSSERTRIARMPSATECMAVDHSFLRKLPEPAKRHFIIGSYVRAGIKYLDPGAPATLAGGYILPLFVCHRKPRYFTDFDEFAIADAVEEIQHFVVEHRSLLPESSHLRFGTRAVFGAALADPITEKDVDWDPDARLATNSLDRNFARFRCALPRVSAGLSAIYDVAEADQGHWPVVSADKSSVGVSILHTPFGGARPSSYDEILGQSMPATARQLTDIALARRTARSAPPAGKLFTRLEVDTLLGDHAADALDLIRGEIGSAELVVVLDVRSSDPAELQRATNHLRANDVAEVCLCGVRERGEVDLAAAIGAHSIKIDQLTVVAAVAGEHQRQELQSLIDAAQDHGLGVVLPGMTEAAHLDLLDHVRGAQILVEGAAVEPND
jgi:hypothetical protein